jgi:uncharacterized BrkB/YihY/UPF0761 family membrane protein
MAEPAGRIERWRARAEQAAGHYQQRAQRQPLLGLPLMFVARYTARQGILLASAAAFRLFLWLLPLALLAAGILGGLSGSGSISHDIDSVSKGSGLTGAASAQVVSALQSSHRSWVIAVITGGVLFLWATRTLMRNLTIVNAHAWAAPVPKASQKHVLINTLIFAGMWLLLFVFVAGLHTISNQVPAGFVIAIVVQGVATSGLWLLLSIRLPDRRDTWLDLVPGAFLFGFGLAVLNFIGRVYLPARIAHSSNIYGPLGIASVMLVWLLLIGQLMVSAALSNAVWHDFRADRRELDPH